MGEVISFNAFNGKRNRTLVQRYGLQRNESKDDSRGFNRKSLIVQFVQGKSFRATGRLHPEGEDGAQNDIRAALMGILPAAAKRAA
jgi:hypothetical protein